MTSLLFLTYRAADDGEKRSVRLICQNTDLGDGWAGNGAGLWCFWQSSKECAYPLGMACPLYALTH